MTLFEVERSNGHSFVFDCVLAFKNNQDTAWLGREMTLTLNFTDASTNTELNLD